MRALGAYQEYSGHAGVRPPVDDRARSCSKLSQRSLSKVSAQQRPGSSSCSAARPAARPSTPPRGWRLERSASAGSVWRRRGEGAGDLPPLAKGSTRHRTPSRSGRGGGARELKRANGFGFGAAPRAESSEAAEDEGRLLLTGRPWQEAVFVEADGGRSGYLLPAEFARLAEMFGRELCGLDVPDMFRFTEADKDQDGVVMKQEWYRFTERLEAAFGYTRCTSASMRFLGARMAEQKTRRRVKNIYMRDGYSSKATQNLLVACSKWNSPALYNNVIQALEQNADPNAGLVDQAFNDYTPLILLAKALPNIPGRQAALSVGALLAAQADIYRECQEMPFGKLTPIRFAAYFQNAGVTEALLRHVDVGDRFQWAATEDVKHVMVQELRERYGNVTAERAMDMERFDMAATAMLRSFACPISGSKLSPEGARRLLTGQFEGVGKADPNGKGLEGETPLMAVVKKGDLETAEALLEFGASPLEQDSSGATPLHAAAASLLPSMARTLLQARAEPHAVDHSGFSPWMIIGEQIRGGGDPKSRCHMLEMLKPLAAPEEVIKQAEEDWRLLIDEEGADVQVLTRRLRLHESLFFNPVTAQRRSCEGRAPRSHLLARLARVLIALLRVDPLEGDGKRLARYFLGATMGPKAHACAHIDVPWPDIDNRADYRSKLAEAVRQMMERFAQECGDIRHEIGRLAAHGGSQPGGSACAALLSLVGDEVLVPQSWQDSDPFWRLAQSRGQLRYDPEWARGVRDSAGMCVALLRVQAVRDLDEYTDLMQLHHAPMEEQLVRGYAGFSRLCNEGFQLLARRVAERVASREGCEVVLPKGVVPAKGLPRLLEKAREARKERGAQQWPGLAPEYLEYSHCFHILDTVRLSFACGGSTVADQVACCMALVREFRACTVEVDGVQLLRQKSCFAEGAQGAGGYADVKLLCYADIGVHTAFDGALVPLRIVGEIQILLEGYRKVQKRMHLCYEVQRGSFDRK